MKRNIVLTLMAIILAIVGVRPAMGQDFGFGGRPGAANFAAPQFIPGVTNQGVTGAAASTGFLNTSTNDSVNANGGGGSIQPNGLGTFNVIDVAVGDVNGDGLQDIASVSTDFVDFGDGNGPVPIGTLVVFVSQGDGTFGLPLPIGLALPAASVATTDIELDGLSDVVVGEYDPGGSGGIVDLYSGAAIVSGAFGDIDIFFGTIGLPISITFGRLNGDAFQDILVAETGSTAEVFFTDFTQGGIPITYNPLSVLLATNGTVGSNADPSLGVFAPRSSFIAQSNFPDDIQAAGVVDGDQDLFIATSLGIEVFENTTVDSSVDPTPTFDPAADILTAGTAPDGVVVADVNKDSIPDVLALNRGSGTVSTFIGSTAVTGGYNAPRQSLTGANPVSLSLMNFDNDGNFDIIVANRGALPGQTPGNVVVLRGSGTGTFVPAQTFSFNATLDSIFNPQSVAVGQFDLSSPTDDIVVAEGVFPGFGSPGGVYFLSAGQGYAPVILKLITAVSLTADFDGTGGLNDLAVIEQNFGIVVVLLNVNIAAPPNVGLITLRDLFTNRAITPTSATAFTDAQTGRSDIAITDVALPQNNPGAGQIVIGINDGSGNFADNRRFRQFTASPGATNVLNGDFNSDGIDDLVYIDFNSNFATVVLNDGTNFFLNNNTRETAGFIPVSARLADVNDDDRLDLVVLNEGAGSGQGNQSIVSILLGSGDGRLNAATSLIQVPNFGISLVGGNADFGATGIPRIVDFNNDGFPDFAVASTRGAISSVGLANPTVSILLNRPDAPGNFNIGSPVPLRDDTAPVAGTVLQLEDTFGGPGLVSGRGGQVTTANTAGAGIGVGGANYVMAVADFNADSFPDLVVSGVRRVTPTLNSFFVGSQPFRSTIYLIGGETNGNLRISRPQRTSQYTVDGPFAGLFPVAGLNNPLQNAGDTFVAAASGAFANFQNNVPDVALVSLNGNLWIDGNISSILNHAPVLTIKRTDLNAPNPGGGRKVIITAGQSFQVPVTGFDIDSGDRLTFRLAQTPTGENPPGFVSIKDNGNKTATVMINGADVNRGPGNAVFRIVVEATDAGTSGPGGRLPLIGREFFTLVVLPNAPPTIGSVPNQTVEAGKTSTVNLIVSDPNGNTVTNTVKCDKGNFVTVNGTTLSIAPQAGDVGSATCTVTATDQFGLSSTTAFAITVTPQNLPPTLASIADQTVKAGGAPVTVQVSANDPNGNAGLRLSLTSAPAFVSLSDNGNGTGVIRITPALTDTQGGRVTVQVTDPAGLTAQTSFNVAVQKAVQITAAAFDTAGKQLFISGTGFGSSGAKVSVNGSDVSARIIGQSDSSITIKGGKKKLNLKAGPNQVVVTSGGVASNSFVVNLLKGE